MKQALLAFTMKRTVTVILLFIISAPVSHQHPIRLADYDGYELIYRTDATTELTGSITMLCRSFTTAEKIPISEVQFRLNSTTCNSTTSLRQRDDVKVLEVDNYNIKFNLTRSLEGYYTCGKQVDENCIMSTERELICKCGYQCCMYQHAVSSKLSLIMNLSLHSTPNTHSNTRHWGCSELHCSTRK